MLVGLHDVRAAVDEEARERGDDAGPVGAGDEEPADTVERGLALRSSN